MSALVPPTAPILPEADAAPPRSGEVSAESLVRVLIVDDEPRNLDVLEAVLESPDYRLVRAATPEAALLALIDGEFAAIVLDVQLPGMTGLELAHLIKQRKRTQDIPIIFLTAYFPEEKFALEGYHAGAVDYLSKPVNPQILRSKVGVFVELHRKTRALADMNRVLAEEVAQRRQAEEALRQANAELEDRVEERTADLLEASRAKDDFLAALSHELRTPLNPALMIASDACENEALPESVRADFTAIRKNIELEAGLIDDLLDLTRITRGKLVCDSRPLALHATVREALSAVQPEVERKALRVSLDLSAARTGVAGDPVRLQQVFWNVLRNAAKFTSDRGQITVRSRNTGDSVIVSVTDDGIGMSPHELARIFTPFTQGDHAADGAPSRFGGLGLGLTIARKIVEHHGGRIAATSPGRGYGSTFEVELPLAVDGQDRLPAGTNGAEAREVSGPGMVRPLRILLVEDHAATRLTLTRLLARRRHTVLPAGSMTEALEFVASGPFDLVVSDIGLPDGDGCALMQQLRRAQPGLPGIALSGYGMERDIERSREAGFSTHFIKPIDVQSLDRAMLGLFPPSG